MIAEGIRIRRDLGVVDQATDPMRRDLGLLGCGRSTVQGAVVDARDTDPPEYALLQQHDIAVRPATALAESDLPAYEFYPHLGVDACQPLDVLYPRVHSRGARSSPARNTNGSTRDMGHCLNPGTKNHAH